MSTTVTTNDFLLPNGTFFVELVWERDDMARGTLEDRERASRKLREDEERYNRTLAAARAEAASIRESAHADGRRLLIELRNQTTPELAAQRERLIRELRPELGEVVMRLAEEILVYEVAADVCHRTVSERFLAERDPLPPTGDRQFAPSARRP